MESQQIVALGIFLAVYAAFTSRLAHRAVAALAGALVLSLWTGPGPLISSLVPEALLVTAGLMVVAGAVKRSGLAAWLALKAAKVGRGRPLPILILTSLVAFGLGAFLGPAAAVLVVPVALLLAVELDLDALPFVVTLSWSALLGGALLMTAQPANLWLVAGLGLAPSDWIRLVAPLAAVALVSTLVTSALVFGPRLRVTNERRARVLEYDARRSLADGPQVVRTLTVTGLVIVGEVAANLGLPVSAAAVALGGAALLMLWEGKAGFDRAYGDLDGGVLVFYGGLFAVVAALGASGLAGALARLLVPSGPVVLGVSALLGALVDHGAVLGALVPFLASWQAAGASHLWVYAVLGTSIGAGVTLWGSAAVSTAFGLAGQGRHAPSVKQFMIYGLVIAVVNVLVVGLVAVWVVR